MLSRTVELFCDVASCRSFSKAAEVNGISQSSVSQSVAQLEKRLGVELIDRTQRPLGLTAAGQHYFEGCRPLIDQCRSLEDSLQEFAKKVAGRLRVAAIYSVGLSEMEHYVSQFAERFPDVELRVDYLHPEEVYDRVSSDMADVGLVSFPRDSGDFACISWQEQRMVVVVPPSHPFAKRGGSSITVAELDGQNFVALTHDLRVRKEIDKWLRQRKVSVNVACEFDNIDAVRRAVEDGMGVALLPSPTVDRSVETGTLVRFELADADWFRPLGLIHKRSRRLSTAADRFIELLHDAPDSKSSPAVPRTSVSPKKTAGRRAKVTV